MDIRRFNAWAILAPCSDLAGQWTAHCLELDVVSQGDSLEHAIAMLSEACAITLVEDLAGGREPLTRRAPEEDFERLYRIVRSGERVPMDLALSDRTGKLVYAMAFELAVIPPCTCASEQPAEQRPAASGPIAIFAQAA